MNSRQSSLVLIIVAYGILIAWMWFLRSTPLPRWQREHLHWNYTFQILFFIIPLAILATRRRSAADYGLTFREPRLHVRIAVMLVIVLVIVPLLIQIFTSRLAANRAFAAFPLSTIIFHFVFSSFGEELFFRGFTQGELNRAFGRPWKVVGVPFGPGLVITTVIFAAAHGLPLLGAPLLSLKNFVMAGLFAFFAGLLRERTGGILAPAMLHATIDLNSHLLRLDPVARIAQYVGEGVAFYFIIWWIADDRSPRRGARLAG